MNTQPAAFKYLGESTVEINGERLEYERTTRHVVHNQKTKRYAMFLGRGMNAFMCVQPIRKNGQISRSKPFWTHSGNWYFVGKIQHCVAFREKQPPNNRLGKFLFKTFSGGALPTYKWTESIELWLEAGKVPAGLWWLLQEREEKESQIIQGSTKGPREC
jgi:hypothetical protein